MGETLFPTGSTFAPSGFTPLGSDALLQALRGFSPGNGSAPGAAGTWSSTGLGPNLGTAQLALGGFGALGNLWSAFQGQGLARKQFDFVKATTQTNLANQIRSYNTQLSDRARSRGAAEGQGQEQIDRYVADNRMAR